jgi:hypothetical protein
MRLVAAIFVVVGGLLAGPSTARAQQASWNGTWIGNWQGGDGAQIVFAGEDLVAFYWHDDYLDDVHANASEGGRVVTVLWSSGQAVLTRDGDATARITVREPGKADLSFALKRDSR